MARIKYTINPEYQNSRYVNYNRWSYHNEVDALVAKLMSNFTASRKKSGYMFNMKVLVLDLFESYSADPEQYIEYQRDNNHFKFKPKKGQPNRYIKNPHISSDYFVGAVDHLDGEYITNSTGKHFEYENGDEYGYLSRMRPTQKFIDICTKYQLTLDMVDKYSEEEVIWLKYPKVKIPKKRMDRIKAKLETKTQEELDSGQPFQYADTDETNAMRNVIRAYNALMDKTCIDLDIECLSYADRDKLAANMTEYDVAKPDIILRLADRNVYRVFNNADTTFRQGGRYFSAWWIGCPSILRKYITIDGSPTVELDYSGIHIHLAYALEGINYAARRQDPYELVDKDPDRELNKLILLTAINAKDDALTASAVFDELRTDGKLLEYVITSYEPLYQILELLKEKHKPIAGYIAENKGIFLQYFDSLVIEKLINHFTSRGIPILTVHDSVVCKEEHQSAVRDMMFQLFADMINNQLKKYVLEKHKDTGNRRTLHIKYQRPIPIKLNWQQLACKKIVRYKSTGDVLPNKLDHNIEGTGRTINYFQRVDDLIKIKLSDERTNKCTTRCNTYKRYQDYLITKKPYRGNIKIKLIKCEKDYIQIYNGH